MVPVNVPESVTRRLLLDVLLFPPRLKTVLAADQREPEPVTIALLFELPEAAETEIPEKAPPPLNTWPPLETTRVLNEPTSPTTTLASPFSSFVHAEPEPETR